MDNVSLSIVIPTLNEEKYLPILLSSLASQINKNFEVIIAEGRSEDKTKEKALEFKKSLNLQVYESDKRNLCYQRNLGAKKAKGDYIIFMDADDSVNSDFIDIVYKKIEKTHADVIIPATIYQTNRLFWKSYSWLSNKFVRLTYFLIKLPFGSGPSVIIKKSVFDSVGGYDESIFYFEDHSLLQSLRKIKAEIVYAKEIIINTSARRMEKTGILKFCYMHLVASIHFLFKGPIKKRIFKFEMGGQAHEKAS